MGMHLFSVKQLLFGRRKYDRVLGGQHDQGSPDLVASPTTRKHHIIHYSNTQISKVSGQHFHPKLQAQEMGSEYATSNGSSATASSSSGMVWGFKMRPKLRMRKQKSSKLVGTSSSSAPQPTHAAVQNFLQGPSQGEGQDEIYQQQCRDLLRKLSARGNRVPGFI